MWIPRYLAVLVVLQCPWIWMMLRVGDVHGLAFLWVEVTEPV